MVTLDGSTEVSSVDSTSIEKKPPADPAMPVAQSDSIAEKELAHHPPTETKETSLETAEKSPSQEQQQQQQQDEEEEEDNHEYPAKWRLALITIALCLSVLCMALVRWANRIHCLDDQLTGF